ncbi:MAG: hypothetical protein WB780_04115 [Candidatus Acidiferrales bacterium]
MEILWPALGISVIVVFVFFVLAQHWHRILRHQSWTIRRLIERMQQLEEVGDPEFRRRLVQFSPSPLEQIFTFSFRLDESFWRETLRASAEDLNFIRAFGSFLGSVKIERWRGRMVATVTEVLPESKAAGWQTRAFDFYAEDAKSGHALTLWEMPLARPRGTAERAPSLGLLLRQDSLELCTCHAATSNGNGRQEDYGNKEILFFRVPLDAARLAEFRSQDPLDGTNGSVAAGNSWQGFYACQDEKLGFEWQLTLRDLERKAEWEQWKILESAPVRTGTE